MSLAPAFPSATIGESIDSDGVASSSASVIAAEFTVRLPDDPLTVIVSSASSSASSVGVSVKVSFALAASAAIVMSKSATAAKSTAVAVPLPATLTVTVVAAAKRGRAVHRGGHRDRGRAVPPRPRCRRSPSG